MILLPHCSAVTSIVFSVLIFLCPFAPITTRLLLLVDGGNLDFLVNNNITWDEFVNASGITERDLNNFTISSTILQVAIQLGELQLEDIGNWTGQLEENGPVLTFTKYNIETDDGVWSGSVTDGNVTGDANFYLVKEGVDSRIVGTIRVRSDVFFLYTIDNPNFAVTGELPPRHLIVRKIDTTQLPSELQPPNKDTIKDEFTFGRRRKQRRRYLDYDDDDDAPKCVGQPAEDLKTIDVMVVVTRAAACAEANQPSDCNVDEYKQPIIDRIRLAVAETNTAYAESGVTKGRVRLVHAYVDESYDEGTCASSSDCTGPTWEDILNDLSGEYDDDNVDGKLDDVHEKRDMYGADLVSLWIDRIDSCGLAWIYNEADPALGFSVVHYDCATGYFSFGHEMAHNQGALHDRANADPSSGSVRFGYHDTNDEFRTVMGYQCTTRDCPRILRFSSSIKTWNGKPTGNAITDNARIIDYTFESVACFRERKVNDAGVLGTDAPTRKGETYPPTPSPTPVSSASSFIITAANTTNPKILFVTTILIAAICMMVEW